MPGMNREAPAAEQSSDVESATRDYVAQHGLHAFMEEAYHLLGTKAEVTLNHANRSLARAFGIHGTAGSRLAKRDVWATIGDERHAQIRRILADFFREHGSALHLGEAQRLFLEWHFTAPGDYGSVLARPSGRYVVGWNAHVDVIGSAEWRLYTFGLIGCAAVFALAEDGAAHLSHYDREVNPTPVALLERFVSDHGDADVYLVGYHARKVAAAIAGRVGVRSRSVHAKPTYLAHTYSVRISRGPEGLRLEHASSPVSDDYVPSAHHDEYGRWFCHGRFGQIFPPGDADFASIPFEPLCGRERR